MKVIVKSLVHWSWLLVLCLIVGWFAGKVLTLAFPPTYQATALIQLNAQSGTSQIIQPIEVYGSLVTSDSLLNPVLKKYPQIDRQSFLSKQLSVNSDSRSQTISIQVTLLQPKVAQDAANMLAQMLIQQQNANIKALYTQEIQIDSARISAEQAKIDLLNRKYIEVASAAVPNTVILQQLNNQISQEQNLQTQDLAARQSLITEQTLFSTPFSLVQSATLPNRSSSIIGLIPLVPLTLVTMLILGLMLIYFLESKAGRINGVYTLQQGIALPVLGFLRWTNPSPQKMSLQALLEARTPYAEDCRIMMADVLFHAENARAKILVLTGLKTRSGTSLIASQLAVLLAQSKRKVLLIDANFHEPTVHKHLGLSNEEGLATLLEEARTAKVVVTSTTEHVLAETEKQVFNFMDIWSAASNQLSAKLRKKRLISENIEAANGASHPQDVETMEQESSTDYTEDADDTASYKTIKVVKQESSDENSEHAIAICQDGAIAIPITEHIEVKEEANANGVSHDQIVEVVEFSVDSYIKSTSFQNLYVLPAGKSLMNPTSLLSMPEMKDLLKWTTQHNDFVVIDCPALIHAESHLLGALSDQTFLVVDATQDRMKQIINAKEELMNTGVKLSGLIVNKLGRWID
jgi:Mrp family chromosome partitioning ATPase